MTSSVPSRRFQAFYGSHRPPLCPARSSRPPHDLGSTFRLTGSTDTGPRPCSCPRAWANRRNTVGESQRAGIGRREKINAWVLFSTSRSPTPTLDTPRGGAILPRHATQTEAGLRLTVAVHGCWMSSETAHMHVRTKICRLASVEEAPMRDVWQPGAALRAISRRLCSPAEVVRTPVQW